MDAARRRLPASPEESCRDDRSLRPPAVEPPGDLARCISAANKVFTALSLASLYLLGRRWREKARTAAPIHVLDHSEIAALLSLVASFVYLVSSSCIARRRLYASQ